METEHVAAPKGRTLATYIEDNHRLLAVLGVFTALTGYSTSLPIKLFGVVLSFCCMGIALLVLVQLWLRFPAHPEDISTRAPFADITAPGAGTFDNQDRAAL